MIVRTGDAEEALQDAEGFGRHMAASVGEALGLGGCTVGVSSMKASMINREDLYCDIEVTVNPSPNAAP